MTYDNYGNILTKNGKTYTYGDSRWKDLLTEYDGQSITYDDGGNPINYLGHTLTWEKGRQLKSFEDITYTYNANGIRTSKTVNGVKHEYTLDGTNIVKETWDGNTLVPLYDNTESVCGITYNGTAYYFLKNLQGDIIAITDNTGKDVARYSYDVWGVCTVTQDISNCDIANINPFRYRGYYFDREIGMYYLQSRYYDPTVGRFVNGDSANLINLSATNLFIYCFNELVNLIDLNGNWPVWIIKKLVGASWKQLNVAEQKLVCKYPFQANSVDNARKQTEKWGKKLYGNSFSKDDNEANAFRHAFWSAAITYGIGVKYAKLFTDAHEYGETGESSKMDLKNNAVGMQLGDWYKSLRKVWTTKDKNKNKNPKRYFFYKSKKSILQTMHMII